LVFRNRNSTHVKIDRRIRAVNVRGDVKMSQASAILRDNLNESEQRAQAKGEGQT
jgi:hypothetical protein